ncbi:hypothetical protein ACFLWY_04975, partial [Chloroflexota bacterium]
MRALLGAPYPRDTTPPVISTVSPSHGGTIETTSSTIHAGYSDTVSGIDEATARIWLDGTEVTDSATANESGTGYRASGLAAGSHTAKVAVSDRAGNGTSRSWSFQVVADDSDEVDDEVDGDDNTGESGIPDTENTSQPGTTVVSEVIDNDGVFTEKATAQSEDSRCRLT